MKNFVKRGDVVTMTATSAVVSGDVVEVGDLIGVAVTSQPTIGEKYELDITGVFDLPKDATLTSSEGELAYWDGTKSTSSTGGGSNALLGVYVQEKIASAPKAHVRLNAAFR